MEDPGATIGIEPAWLLQGLRSPQVLLPVISNAEPAVFDIVISPALAAGRARQFDALARAVPRHYTQ